MACHALKRRAELCRAGARRRWSAGPGRAVAGGVHWGVLCGCAGGGHGARLMPPRHAEGRARP